MSTVGSEYQIVKSQVISLAEASLSEVMLEKLIVDDPSILGLGDLVVIEHQRAQHKAGRLDLLLEDGDGELRFEVELMLGSLDESHLVRAIEYWDIERRHYPGYEHCAVIVAEDVTSRFLNVIQLFSGSIPLVAVQVNCIKIEGALTLNFIKLLDSRMLRRDDRADIKAKATDRNYWITSVGQAVIGVADECLAIINSFASRKRSLNYNKQFIGLLDGIQPNNFVYFLPRKQFMRIRADVTPVDPWVKRLSESGMDFKLQEGIKVSVAPQLFGDVKGVISDLLQAAVKQDEA